MHPFPINSFTLLFLFIRISLAHNSNWTVMKREGRQHGMVRSYRILPSLFSSHQPWYFSLFSIISLFCTSMMNVAPINTTVPQGMRAFVTLYPSLALHNCFWREFIYEWSTKDRLLLVFFGLVGDWKIYLLIMFKMY